MRTLIGILNFLGTKNRENMLKLAFIGALLLAANKDPLHLNSGSKMKNIKVIVHHAEQNNYDPYELLAVASVESSFNSKAISSAGAVGLFQVMCKFWYKQAGYKTIPACNKDLLNPRVNVKMGAKILTLVRNKYPQCAGTLAYRCYFAGHGWKRYRGKTAKQIERYESKVKERFRILKEPFYVKMIEDIREQAKNKA